MSIARNNRPIKKVLIANRSEIAIRVMRAATELGIRTVAIYAQEDHLSLHRFKADESYLVGAGKGPVQAYLDISDIIRIAKQCGADSVHPGYGFLSENPDFAAKCEEEGLIFIGPSPEIMRGFGDKVSARNLAVKAGVPVIPASEVLPQDEEKIGLIAAEIQYPLMLKASWGGGGRGMRVIKDQSALHDAVAAGRKEAKSAFGKDDVYLEKLISNARHVEVQLLGDRYGNLVHLYERDCSVQRRHQKVVERAPAPYLSEDQRAELADMALRIGRSVEYINVGTVEFLMDVDTGAFYFIEVNPRIQVEHTVTEEVTGIDIVKAQINVAQGYAIGDDSQRLPTQDQIRLRGHALQCRVTTEDPEHGFTPDFGRLLAYRGATGFGVRLDGGTAYSGAVVTQFYDSLLEKVTTWAPTAEEAMNRMSRALTEFRIRGVSTNLAFLNNVINHPDFRRCNYTTAFIDQTPSLFEFTERRDRATKLLRYLAEVSVNGNSQVKDRPKPKQLAEPQISPSSGKTPPKGLRDRLKEVGPYAFGQWVKSQSDVLFTDTTMRDAHQSLLATRMRTHDMVKVAPYYANYLSNLFSLECWGGATFDVAMRFLQECPWQRLEDIRDAVPNIPLQMLLRASNAVGYRNYPDNVVEFFIRRAAESGIDIFRVFDSLNWADNMYVAMDAIQKTGAVCEATICYSGDLTSAHETTFTLDYYLELAKKLETHGAHILAVKDMAGICKPEAAKRLVGALKAELTLPIHFHTHDTSGTASASVIAAIAAGADIVDCACDALSGLTAQPSLGGLLHALPISGRTSQLNKSALYEVNAYWESVRDLYVPFEGSVRSSQSEVYHHEMPGGQITNLKEQARALGLGSGRWSDIASAYAEVNQLFGNIVKVTPSSKVVGDMALAMVSSGLSKEDVLNPDKDVSFPESVISFFKGELGQPTNGFPQALQQKVLKGAPPLNGRPGARLVPVDFESERKKLEVVRSCLVNDNDLAAYLLYPEVSRDLAEKRVAFGDVSVLPTTAFFYGLKPGDEIRVELEPGKTLFIRCLSISAPHSDGLVQVFFELNGQPRTIKVRPTQLHENVETKEKARPGDPYSIGAPMTGVISEIRVIEGERVAVGDILLTFEAMKMEVQIISEVDGVVDKILVTPGEEVRTKELMLELQAIT